MIIKNRPVDSLRLSIEIPIGYEECLANYTGWLATGQQFSECAGSLIHMWMSRDDKLGRDCFSPVQTPELKALHDENLLVGHMGSAEGICV